MTDEGRKIKDRFRVFFEAFRDIAANNNVVSVSFNQDKKV